MKIISSALIASTFIIGFYGVMAFLINLSHGDFISPSFFYPFGVCILVYVMRKVVSQLTPNWPKWMFKTSDE